MRDRSIRLAVVMAVMSLVGGCQSCGLDFDIADLNPFDCDTCATPAQPVADVCAPPQDPCAPVAQPVVATQPVGNRPPDARAGEVWCYVRVPPVTRQVTEQVCVQQEGCNQVWIAPVTQQVTENICTQPESARQVTIPAQFQDVSEQVCVAPGKTEWRRVECDAKSSLRPQEQIGECWTLTDIPPQYRVDTKRVCTVPESCRTEVIPAVFQSQTKTVTVTEGYYRQDKVPAVFETRTKEVPVCGPRWEWRRTRECEVPEAAGDFVPAPAADPLAAPAATGGFGAADGNALPPAEGVTDGPPAGDLPPLDPMAPIR